MSGPERDRLSHSDIGTMHDSHDQPSAGTPILALGDAQWHSQCEIGQGESRPARKGVAPMPDRKCVRAGTCYPTNYVGALVDRRPDAEAAAQAMRSARITDVELIHVEESLCA